VDSEPPGPHRTPYLPSCQLRAAVVNRNRNRKLEWPSTLEAETRVPATVAKLDGPGSLHSLAAQRTRSSRCVDCCASDEELETPSEVMRDGADRVLNLFFDGGRPGGSWNTELAVLPDGPNHEFVLLLREDDGLAALAKLEPAAFSRMSSLDSASSSFRKLLLAFACLDSSQHQGIVDHFLRVPRVRLDRELDGKACCVWRDHFRTPSN
jgi:hypothetical protein